MKPNLSETEVSRITAAQKEIQLKSIPKNINIESLALFLIMRKIKIKNNIKVNKTK